MARMPPSRQSSQSSSWVVVETSSHTRSRSPQFNANNWSSSQVANALAKSGSSSIFLSPDTGREDGNNVDDAVDPAYRLDHKPPSNGTDDTAGTEETVVGPRNTDNNNNNNNNNPTPTAYPPLTDTNITLLQRELAQRWAGDVNGWVDGAGIGTRLLLNKHEQDGSMFTASHAARAGHSRFSGSSVGGGAGLDWAVIPAPTPADEELNAVGMWSFGEGPLGAGRRGA